MQRLINIESTLIQRHDVESMWTQCWSYVVHQVNLLYGY